MCVARSETVEPALCLLSLIVSVDAHVDPENGIEAWSSGPQQYTFVEYNVFILHIPRPSSQIEVRVPLFGSAQAPYKRKAVAPQRVYAVYRNSEKVLDTYLQTCDK